jgi:hypothetical protein
VAFVESSGTAFKLQVGDLKGKISKMLNTPYHTALGREGERDKQLETTLYVTPIAK